MIIKYISFLLGLIWSYSFIRTQSIFSNKTALLFKIFISKVSWFTFIAACYFGYKNFSFKYEGPTYITTNVLHRTKNDSNINRYTIQLHIN